MSDENDQNIVDECINDYTNSYIEGTASMDNLAGIKNELQKGASFSTTKNRRRKKWGLDTDWGREQSHLRIWND